MAIWDGLVTGEERAVYRKAGYGHRHGFGTRAALLIVDVEYNFTGEAPEPVLDAIERFKNSCGHYAWVAIPRIRRLLARARRARIPVFFTHGIPEAAGRDGRPDRGTTIVREVAPGPGEIVIAKAAPSAFFGTPLAAHLVDRRVDTVIVTGCTTSGCVRATVVDSYSYRFHTVVPIEAVFDRAETPHRVNLFDMAMKYARVAPAREVEAWLAGSAEASGAAGSPSRLSRAVGRRGGSQHA